VLSSGSGAIKKGTAILCPSEALWQKAVALARKHGPDKTAGALGLKYYFLRKQSRCGRRRAKEYVVTAKVLDPSAGVHPKNSVLLVVKGLT